MEKHNKRFFKGIHYSRDNTVLLRIQTDTKFIEEIKKIHEKKKSLQPNLFRNQTLMDDDFLEQIHQKATLHSNANIFNNTSILEYRNIEDSAKCTCGCRRGVCKTFPVTLNEQNLNFLGPGIILFFMYLRHIRILMMAVFFIYGLFALVSNVVADQHEHTSEDGSEYGIFLPIFYIVKVSSYSNKLATRLLKAVQFFLGFLFCFMWILGGELIKILGQEKDRQIDNLLDSASDYTIRIENLPYGKYDEEQLIQYLKELWEMREVEKKEDLQKEINLKSVQIVYNMSECRQLINEILQDSEKLYAHFIYTNYRFSNTIKTGEEEIYMKEKKNLIKKIVQLEKMRKKFIQNPEYRKNLSTTCAIVEFHDNSQQLQFLKNFQSNNMGKSFLSNKELPFKDCKLIISRAPEPSDLMVKNCEKPFSWVRQSMIIAATALILLVGYALISFFITLEFISNSNIFLIALTLQLLNRVIWICLSFLSPYEYSNTKTDALISLMKKSLVAQAINIIVNPIISIYANGKDIYGYLGLEGVAVNFQLAMLFMMFVYYLFNPFYLIKILCIKIKCVRHWVTKYLCEVSDKYESHDYMRPVLDFYEGPQFPISGSYVYITTSILHCMFYCHLIPSLVLFVIFNMTVFFYILKYILFKRCKIPELTELRVFQLAISAMQLGPAFYGAGSTFFLLSASKGNTNYLDILHALLCVLLVIVYSLYSQLFEKILMTLLNFFGLKTALISGNSARKVEETFNAHMYDSSAFENTMWQRKESYYHQNNAKHLFYFQKFLKDIDGQDEAKYHHLKNFCESFCKRQPTVVCNLEMIPEKYFLEKERSVTYIIVQPAKEKESQ